MGARPDLVAAGYLAPVLQHFSDLLSKGTRGRSIKAGSLASLHGVVHSLDRFLSAATAALAGHAAGAAQQGQGQQGRQEGRQRVLMWRRCRWPPAGAARAAAAAEGSGGGAAGGGTHGDAAGTAAAAELLGHLLAAWSEAGPSQLAEAPDLVAAQCLTAILRRALLHS